MKLAPALIISLFIWLLPPSQALAGTWSWHSDAVQTFMHIIQYQRELRQEKSAARPNDVGTVDKKTAPRGAVKQQKSDRNRRTFR